MVWFEVWLEGQPWLVAVAFLAVVALVVAIWQGTRWARLARLAQFQAAEQRAEALLR
jgi:uncharacterized membrane protein YcjF (UPF0283 family)